MEKEIELLSRVAANHLFLAQFEPLRAVLLSLRKRRPDLAVAILRAILYNGGRIDGVLFSGSCHSPAHLCWLSALLLLEIGTPSTDPDILKLKAEFLLLVQLVSSKHRSSGMEQVEKDEIIERDTDVLSILDKVLELGFRSLKSEVSDDAGVLREIPSLTDDDMRILWKVFIDYGDVFDALCWNIQRQLRWSESEEPDLAASIGGEGEQRVGSAVKEVDALAQMQRSVQLARLDALRERFREGDIRGAASHLRFLRLDYGVDETEYK